MDASPKLDKNAAGLSSVSNLSAERGEGVRNSAACQWSRSGSRKARRVVSLATTLSSRQPKFSLALIASRVNPVKRMRPCKEQASRVAGGHSP
jgi:hypothetical protein